MIPHPPPRSKRASAEIRAIPGPVDDLLLVEITRTGLTAAEVLAAELPSIDRE
jgi:hypothetical protein